MLTSVSSGSGTRGHVAEVQRMYLSDGRELERRSSRLFPRRAGVWGEQRLSLFLFAVTLV